MGTSSSYSGGGGSAGRDLRDGVSEWLDSLPVPENRPEPAPEPDGVGSEPPAEIPTLPPESIVSVLDLFELPVIRARRTGSGSSDGPGGGGGGTRVSAGGGRQGGTRRSTSAAVRTAGRAAAAAYALRTGNAAALSDLGLDYSELRALDPIEQVRRIVEFACGPTSDGSIEDDERRHVAAYVAGWVLEQGEAGAEPDLEEIVRETITTIIFEAATTETGNLIRSGQRPPWVSIEGERQMRDAAHAIVQRAQLSPTSPEPEEMARVIAEGIQDLRHIWGVR